jgi:hypothetical protein
MPLWYAKLSEESPDWYDAYEDYESPPFFLSFVEAGSRIGYQWKTNYGDPCEVNWLDPEPDKGSSDYSKYIQDLQDRERNVDFFSGFNQPPTEEEYNEL